MKKRDLNRFLFLGLIQLQMGFDDERNINSTSGTGLYSTQMGFVIFMASFGDFESTSGNGCCSTDWEIGEEL